MVVVDRQTFTGKDWDILCLCRKETTGPLECKNVALFPNFIVHGMPLGLKCSLLRGPKKWVWIVVKHGKLIFVTVQLTRVNAEGGGG